MVVSDSAPLLCDAKTDMHQSFAIGIDELSFASDAGPHMPENETIDLISIWVSECYVYSMADELLRHFENLGWDEKQAPVNRSSSPDVWLKDQKYQPNQAATYHFNTIVPTAKRDQWLHPQFEANLPSCVLKASGTLRQVFPGLFILCMRFDLIPECGKILQATLTNSYDAYFVPKKSGGIYVTPNQQRAHAAARVRNNYRLECVRWMAENLPGFFSATANTDLIPSAEFLTLEVGSASDEREFWDMGHYQRILGMAQGLNPLQFYDLPALKVRIQDHDSLVTHMIRTFANKYELLKLLHRLPQDQRDPRSGLAWHASSLTSPLLSVWTVFQLLGFYENQYLGLVEELGRPEEWSQTPESIDQQSRLESSALKLSMEALPLIQQMRLFLRDEGVYEYLMPLLVDEPERFSIDSTALIVESGTTSTKVDSNSTVSFRSNLRTTLQRQCELIEMNDSIITQSAVSQAQLTLGYSQHQLALSNQKLQRGLAILSVIVAVTAFIQLVLTFR